MAQRQGQFIQYDYFNNVGGINNTDSPFAVKSSQADVNSRNLDYTKAGGVKKRSGLTAVNSTVDTQTRTYSMTQRVTKDDTRSLIRAAGRKIQLVDASVPSFTNLTEDTSAVNSDFLAASTAVPVADSFFSTISTDVTWLSGGGMDDLYGAYSTTKVTKNGTVTPTGSLGTPVIAGAAGVWAGTGVYYYAVAFRKAGTGAISNADLDVKITIAATSELATIDLTGITGLDTTKHDKIYLYRSAVSGVTDFTTGDLVAQITSTETSYPDDGSSISSTVNIPRSGNTVLDNTDLPAGTYKYSTVFKRRLVTASENTLYISDLNKPESWPLHNYIQLPSGGSITGLAIISFTTPTTSNLDEYLIVFKEDEMSVLTGTGTLTSDVPDWALKFIDVEGCSAHNSIVNGNGYITWINRRGIFLWSGSGKPIYSSRLIESYFAGDGDLDKTKLYLAWGKFYKKQNQIIWYLSHKVYGEQKFSLKLDLRLTMPSLTSDLAGNIIEAVFIPDTYAIPQYHGVIHRPTGQTEDTFYIGDNTGTIYTGFTGGKDIAAGINFYYGTSHLDQESPGTKKSYSKVIVWVEDIGNWDLDLEYWSDYRVSDSEKTSNTQKVSVAQQSGMAIWDVASWDVALWDSYETKFRPLVYHLRATDNNNIGDALKLRFKQTVADNPVLIAGFSVIYSVIGETR